MKQCTRCGYMNDAVSACKKCGTGLGSGTHTPVKRQRSEVTHTEDEWSSQKISERLSLAVKDRLLLSSGRYNIIDELGDGGFGTVFKIQDTQGVDFAFKILKLWDMFPKEHAEIKERFLREYKAGRIESPNIVPSHYYGSIKGNPYIIMKFCPNGNLEDRILKLRNDDEVSSIAQDVIYGLSDLHKNGIIHRDIKPGNVLFDANNKALLTDFGISGFVNKRQTQTRRGRIEQIWGTVAYMPPEMFDEKKAFKSLGAITDVFAFGVMMYEVLTKGKHPFSTKNEFAEDQEAYKKKVKNGEMISIRNYRPDISYDWESLIVKCLKPNPSERFQTVEEMLALIRPSGIAVTDPEVNANVADKDVIIGVANEWVLRVMNGQEVGREYNLNNILLGKESKGRVLKLGWAGEGQRVNNDVGIQDKFSNYISSNHATLEFKKSHWVARDGQWCYKQGRQDWHPSLNGTKVNYNKIEQLRGTQIKHGDIITVGDTTLKVIHL